MRALSELNRCLSNIIAEEPHDCRGEIRSLYMVEFSNKKPKLSSTINWNSKYVLLFVRLCSFDLWIIFVTRILIFPSVFLEYFFDFDLKRFPFFHSLKCCLGAWMKMAHERFDFISIWYIVLLCSFSRSIAIDWKDSNLPLFPIGLFVCFSEHLCCSS